MLSTPRLILRPWRETDLDPFAAQNANPQVMEFFERTFTRAETAAAIARYTRRLASDGFGMLAIERREDRAFIGVAGIQRILFEAPFAPAVEIGWRLTPAALGAGLRHGGRARGVAARLCAARIVRDRRHSRARQHQVPGGNGAHRHEAGP